MGFETPKSPLSDYLNWTTSGRLQLLISSASTSGRTSASVRSS
jgi:hypothetical protein